MDKINKKTHTESNTTVRINATHWPFSCGFFCNRMTDSDVIEPSKTSKECHEHPAIKSTNPGLRPK